MSQEDASCSPLSSEVATFQEPATAIGSEPGTAHAKNPLLDRVRGIGGVVHRGSPSSVASSSIHDPISPTGEPPNVKDQRGSALVRALGAGEAAPPPSNQGDQHNFDKGAASLSSGTSAVKIALHSMRLSDFGTGIPASPTDRLLSPTTRRLRKHGKTFADDRYKLQEAAGTVCPGFSSDEERESDAISTGVSDANLAPIVLGCSWPIRREILAEHSWKFSVLESDFNFEGVIGSSTDSPLHVAKATAHALSSHFDECAPPVVLLTVAQVFVVDGAVRHPAQTENDAIALLRAVSNKVITLRTAVVATQCPHGRQAEEIDECTVEFGPISDDLATRVAKRTFSKPCSGIPLRDPEIKLRCKLLSGSEEAALGMPIEAARRVVGAAVAPCGASEYSHKPFSR